MKVDVWNKEGMVLLTRDGGESLKISILEFWEICRIGQRLDVRDEVENYLDNGGDFEGVDADTVRRNPAFMDEVIEQVITDRTRDETGDQIYDAICYCVKHGKNKDDLVAGGSRMALADMELEDFKDPGRRKEFNGLMHAYRDLKRRMDEQNGMPFGGDRHMQDFLKKRLGDVTTKMDLLRVKEWLSKQPYDLDTESAGYREAMDMLEEICGWAFPELAAMIFDGEDNDLIFREPHDSGLYVWTYYNPDAIAGGQIVENSFGVADSPRIAEAAAPADVFDANHVYLSDINTKGFFLTIFDMLKWEEEGFYLGSNLKEICRDIAGKKYGQSVWHGDVDVPYGFPGLDAIVDCDSMELAAPEMLLKLLRDGTGFRNVSVEQIGYYKNGIGFSFSFDTNLSADRAGSLLQKALHGLKFEACSDVSKARFEEIVDDAVARSNEQPSPTKTDFDKQNDFMR